MSDDKFGEFKDDPKRIFSGIDKIPRKFGNLGDGTEQPNKFGDADTDQVKGRGISRFLSDPCAIEDVLIISEGLARRHQSELGGDHGHVGVNRSNGDVGWGTPVPGNEFVVQPRMPHVAYIPHVSTEEIDEELLKIRGGTRIPQEPESFTAKQQQTDGDSFIFGNEMKHVVGRIIENPEDLLPTNKFGESYDIVNTGLIMGYPLSAGPSSRSVPIDPNGDGLEVSFTIQDLPKDLVHEPLPRINDIEIKGVVLRDSRTPLKGKANKFGERQKPALDKFMEEWAANLHVLPEEVASAFHDKVLGDISDRVESGNLSFGTDFDGDTGPLRYPTAEAGKFGDVDQPKPPGMGGYYREELLDSGGERVSFTVTPKGDSKFGGDEHAEKKAPWAKDDKFGSDDTPSERTLNEQALGRSMRRGQPAIGYLLLVDEDGKPVKKDDKFGGW